MTEKSDHDIAEMIFNALAEGLPEDCGYTLGMSNHKIVLIDDETGQEWQIAIYYGDR